MIQLHIQSKEALQNSIAKRTGETKLGETLHCCYSLEDIKKSDAHYVIFGIAEDIGVQANYGKSGTSKAWKTFLTTIVNCQENSHNHGNNILILGHISVTPDIEITSQTPKELLGDIVKRIDSKVAQVVKTIIDAGKFPIIIGGGHNNAYGNLKGASQAYGKAINAINIDAHTDLRHHDYRHSGNGFSYALHHPETPFLDKYVVYGLHKNYTPQYIFDQFEKHSQQLKYYCIEDLWDKNKQIEQFKIGLSFVKQEPFGIELDCDAIAHFPSSAQSPLGFDLDTVVQCVTYAASQKKCTYFHICEAAPTKKTRGQVGKALSYLVTDFIRHNDANS